MAQEIRDQNKILLEKYNQMLQEPETSKNAALHKDLSREISKLNKHADMDLQEARKIEDDSMSYLINAIDNYGKCAAMETEKYDTSIVFRLCSLLFNNASNEGVCKAFENACGKVSSHKFVPLIYQIASRLGYNECRAFRAVHEALVKRIVQEHPHLSLYQIFALKMGDKIPNIQRGKANFEVDKDKIRAASSIIEFAKKGSSELSETVAQMEKLIDAYIELAFIYLEKEKYMHETRPINMSEILKIRQIKSLHKIPVPTIEFKARPDGDYSDIDRVESFEETFNLCGGINLPRIVKCFSSSGMNYRQLVKGIDDLRQDAVMEQMFGLVNNLLLQDPETRKRGLKIRTYKVIPLAPTAGILGWVENTIPLADYLAGKCVIYYSYSYYFCRCSRFALIYIYISIVNISGIQINVHIYIKKKKESENWCSCKVQAPGYFFARFVKKTARMHQVKHFSGLPDICRAL